jgi:hypothetical protein
MTEISRPAVSEEHPDRHILCQDAIQSAFRSLVEDATAAGWTERESVAAVIDLADNHMLSIAANDETFALIELLKRMT